MPPELCLSNPTLEPLARCQSYLAEIQGDGPKASLRKPYIPVLTLNLFQPFPTSQTAPTPQASILAFRILEMFGEA